MFFFSKTQGGLPQYLLVLASFSIAWFELWLMPFKVLPREKRYELHHNSISVDSPSSLGPENSRRDVMAEVGGVTRVVRPRVVDRLTASAYYPTFSTDDEFRSAVDYSSDEETVIRRPVYSQIPAMLRETYEKTLYDAEVRVESLLQEAQMGNWKALRVDNPMVLLGPDGSYLIKAQFSCSPIILFDAAWKDVLKWNPQVLTGKTVMCLDSTTELFHSVSAPALKGYVSSRDFLDIRRIRLNSEAETYSGIFVSVDSTLCPANADKKLVRGHNGPSMMRTSPGFDATGPSAHLEWIMRTDLRGGLPRRLIQSSMLGYFVEHVDRLRKYVESMSSTDA